MKRKITYLLLILPGLLFSQTHNFVSFGVEEGLAQSQVQTIVQDNDANLWIGTLAGLTKYNGKSFVTYSKQDGLAEEWITASCKDANGDLWFGHWAGGLSRYNVKYRKFENFELENYTRYKTVTSIIQDKKKRMWITTEGSGVFIYDAEKNKMLGFARKEGTRTNNFYDSAIDSLDRLWLASDSGLVIVDTKKEEVKLSDMIFVDRNKGLSSNHITSVAIIDKNEVWFGTADKGVIAAPLPDEATLKTSLSPLKEYAFLNSKNGINSDFIENIYEDSRRNIWISTTGGGVSKCTFNNAYARLKNIDKATISNYSTRQGLNYFNVNKVFEDREGNIWIGTDMGLNQYRGDRFLLYTTSDGIINNLVWTVLNDREGNLWLGTNEGISKVTFLSAPVNGKNYTVKNFTDKEGLTSNVVFSLHEDAEGNIWCGTGYGGVCKLARGAAKFESYAADKGLTNDAVYAICSGNEGDIWFGTKDGAIRYFTSPGTYKIYTAADSLGGNNIYRIFKDSKGNIWFGALGGDLSVYDGKKMQVVRDSSGLGHRFILCINEDDQHNLWFGAYGGGLYKYDGNTFKQFSVNDGMTSNSPYSIMPDNSGNLWIGHSHGLDKLDSASQTFRQYSKPEGFMGAECNPNAISKDRNGNIWFGTISGVAMYNPAEDRQNSIEPKVLLTGLKVFMKDAPFPDDARFRYDHNHLTFSFVGVSLTTPRKVKYQYKLEGFDLTWSPGQTFASEVVYSNLPPGKYIFMVRACNNKGVWNKEPLRYKFFIAPPFWQTGVFYFLMIVFVAFCLYGALRIRRKNLASEKKKLEEDIKELKKTNKQLERKLRGEPEEEEKEENKGLGE